MSKWTLKVEIGVNWFWLVLIGGLVYTAVRRFF